LKAIARGTAGNSIALAYTDNDTNVGATKSGTALTGGVAASADYAAVKLQIATLVKQHVVAGVVSQGSEVVSVVLSNGQSFDFKFYLPDRIPILLRLTATESENTLLVTPSDETIREKVFANAGAAYKLGLNFEPQRYYTLVDAPWASSLVLEWSDDGGTTWHSGVYDADFDDVFEFDLEDIEVVVT
jgi:hypothetical protein